MVNLVVHLLDLEEKLASIRPIEKMQAAKSLSTTLDEVCVILEQGYLTQIIESASDDAQLREHIYHRLRVLKDMKVVLTKIVATGQVAEADIMHIAKIQSGELKEFY